MVREAAYSFSVDSPIDAHALPETVNVDGAYVHCDPGYAQAWLDRSGLDITQVARMSCLSLAQVRQLLQGADGSFYSPAIKQRAYRRVLALLGAPEPARPAPEASVPEQVVGLTVDNVPRRPITYTAWAWLGLVLLIGAATAEWWHGWLSSQVLSFRPQLDVQAPAGAAPTTAASAEAASTEVPTTGSENQVTLPPPMTHSQAPTAAATSAPPCAYVAQPVTTVMPAVAEKPGNYVYVQALREAEVCVIDGDRKVTHLQLKAGEHRSIYGSPPWQLSGLDLGQLQIYFQGWRVLLPEMATQQVALVERSR